MVAERRLLVDQDSRASDAETIRIKLPRQGFLSALDVRVRITNGATAGEEPVLEAIDRIEVIGDGSRVLFSLEGQEAYRWGFVHYGRRPPEERDEAAGAVQELCLPVYFGRYLGDPEFNLDLSQYRDVELRIQTSPTIAATSFATATLQVHIPMWIWEQAPPFRRGFLRTQQVKAFTSAASGEDRTELARLNPYHDILVYAREAAIEDGTDITRVAVELNDGRVIPHDGRWDDWQAENEKMLHIDNTALVHALRTDNAALSMYTGRLRDARVELVRDLAAAADFNVANVASFAGDQITLHMVIVEGSATYAATILETTRREMFISARGLGIPHAVLIPFVLNGNPDTALDPTAGDVSKLELVLTQGAAGADVRISTREIMPAAV